MQPEVSVVIPVHNEATVIRTNVLQLREFLSRELSTYEIYLVENGSQDETGKIAQELSEEFTNVAFISLPEPNLALALKRGFQTASAKKIVYYPIDLSIDLDFIPVSVKLLDEYDIVLGSKRLDVDLDKRPLARRLSSKAYHRMVRKFLGTELTDTTGVKAYRKEKILSIIDRIPTSSRIFETELIVESQKEGFKIVEIPVWVEERRQSRESLMKKIQGKFEDLLSARLDLITFYVGIPLFLFGLLFMSYLILEKILSNNPTGFLNPYSFMLSMLFVISGFQIITFGLLVNLILQIRREINQ